MGLRCQLAIFFSKTVSSRVILCEINTGRNHPDPDLSVIHYIGLFCPKKNLINLKKLNSLNFSKYAPLKSDRGVSSFVIIWIWIIKNMPMIVIFNRKRMLFLIVMQFLNFRLTKKKNLKNPPLQFFYLKIYIRKFFSKVMINFKE